MMRRRTLVPLILTAGLLPAAGLTVAAVPALAASITHRTTLLGVTLSGDLPDGPVFEAVLSGGLTTAAFTTTATNMGANQLNGPIADVMTIDLLSGRQRVVSEAFDGTGANGPSRSPAISAFGTRVAFASDATNLVEGDTNGLTDIFVRQREGTLARVSVALDGGNANGPSSQPDISADGRIVVFTSAATNLVPGDTNGVADVFARDLTLGTTRRVSVSSDGTQANGPSSAPASDGDGGAIAFESAASNLASGDTNGVDDVFVHQSSGGTDRVSVSSAGRQQDKAIARPYAAAPDISGDGRYVVFDTDATTLYNGDTNQRTDVYLRDRRRRTTTLVSASSLNVQGNNDSITPRITPNGRFVTFQSFASNLVRDDGPREDLFVRDRRAGTTALVNATDSGERREGEPGGSQLLQRASISDDGRYSLFLSAATNITKTTTVAPRRLYLRQLTAPVVSVRSLASHAGGVVRLRLQADDPTATRFLCRVDRAVPFYCGPVVKVPRTAGRILSFRAGGPGMLWSAARTIPLTDGWAGWTD
ncbi:MAG: hypothetical protein JWM31_2759 [Solirubrobacterales bacterium]|nr:hypothetical protein [Solirubrobacterales bacterium]